MLTRLDIKKLFDRFDYNIVLKPEGITILTGPNGYGKSTILKCIEALSQGDIYFFSELDFKEINFYFDNLESETISIIKTKNELFINKNRIPLKKLAEENRFKNKHYIIRIDEDKWLDRRNGEIFDKDFLIKEMIYNKYENQITFFDEDLSFKFSDISKKLKESTGKIYYIKEQRLIQRKVDKNEPKVINVIEELPKKLKNLISEISNDYSTVANELDSSYPNRLFSMDKGISEIEYKNQMEEMTNKFEKLNKYDISALKTSANVIFKAEHNKALKIYFDDFNIKYKVYEDFIRKLDIFTNIVNGRLSYKQIKISREYGIIVTDNENSNKTLKLSQLSSGEKQVIVLFYELIFEVPNNLILLIDEPEISLHITWQKKFMDDLLQIVDYKGIKVIVATHSPQIINNHWDRQIDLGLIYGNDIN